jgi:hypothetical protein
MPSQQSLPDFVAAKAGFLGRIKEETAASNLDPGHVAPTAP